MNENNLGLCTFPFYLPTVSNYEHCREHAQWKWEMECETVMWYGEQSVQEKVKGSNKRHAGKEMCGKDHVQGFSSCRSSWMEITLYFVTWIFLQLLKWHVKWKCGTIRSSCIKQVVSIKLILAGKLGKIWKTGIFLLKFVHDSSILLIMNISQGLPSLPRILYQI